MINMLLSIALSSLNMLVFVFSELTDFSIIVSYKFR